MPPTATYPASAQPGDSIMFALRTSHSSDNNISPRLLHLDNWFIETQRDQTNTKIRTMINMTILTLDTWHLVQLFQNIERGFWIIKGPLVLVPVTAPIMILLITITAESRNAGADAAYQIYPRVLRCVIMSGGGVSAVSHTRDHDQWSGGPSRLQVRCQCVDVHAGCAVGVGWHCFWDHRVLYRYFYVKIIL